MKSNEAVTALNALASDPRLTVYRLLVKRGPEGYTPSELIERLDVPAPTLSFHLKGLMHAGLVASRRERRNLHYRPLWSGSSPRPAAALRARPATPTASRVPAPRRKGKEHEAPACTHRRQEP